MITGIRIRAENLSNPKPGEGQVRGLALSFWGPSGSDTGTAKDGAPGRGGVEALLFQNGARGLLGTNPESRRIDFRVKWASASCCGVNLAVAGFGVGLGGAVLFPRAFELCNF